MSYRFQDCVSRRGVVKRPASRAMVEKELAEAKRDLDSAKNSLCDSDFKWTIIKAYYSMFHACKSLLFRIKSGLIPAISMAGYSPSTDNIIGRCHL